MKDKILQKLFLGFVQVHILYHAKEAPVYGVWMMNELKEHGYTIGPGTLYPILNKMDKNGLLTRDDRLVRGKIRKYYSITHLGEEIFHDAAKQAAQLFHEIEGKK